MNKKTAQAADRKGLAALVEELRYLAFGLGLALAGAAVGLMGALTF